MAQSPSHAWGQIVGTVVELGVVPILEEIALEYNLYLDSQGDRPARSGRKVTWKDKFGNKHDLDYVFEKHGTPTVRGVPVGFVEVAWRRYTKHSKNKAQELQGAVQPLVETYSEYGPFMAAIIAGRFTAPSIDQLKSLGFIVLHFLYEDVVQAFQIAGIDASYDEGTPDEKFAAKIGAWHRLTDQQQGTVVRQLIGSKELEVSTFVGSLRSALGREISRIIVVPLFGSQHEFQRMDDALSFLSSRDLEDRSDLGFVRIEVEIRYTNGDSVVGSYGKATDAADFLRRVCGGEPTSAPIQGELST